MGNDKLHILIAGAGTHNSSASRISRTSIDTSRRFWSFDCPRPEKGTARHIVTCVRSNLGVDIRDSPALGTPFLTVNPQQPNIADGTGV
jgi:hypothetical protein